MNFSEIVESFNGINALILGDVMIDRYLIGSVDRISPEAPVPIVKLERRDDRLGGAANVAINIKKLGANPLLYTVIGDDNESDNFLKILKDENISSLGIIKESKKETTVKNRILSKNQQLIRFDSENTSSISSSSIIELKKRIDALIQNEKIDVVILQDYNKGVLTTEIIEKVIDLSNSKNIPIIVDPKKENFFNYKNVTLFKPNLKEVVDVLGKISLDEASDIINKKLNNKFTLITLSENGIYLRTDDKKVNIPTVPRYVVDVCGAGDTVTSVISLCLSRNINIESACELANIAGGIVCESVGVTPIDKLKLMNEFK